MLEWLKGIAQFVFKLNRESGKLIRAMINGRGATISLNGSDIYHLTGGVLVTPTPPTRGHLI